MVSLGVIASVLGSRRPAFEAMRPYLDEWVSYMGGAQATRRRERR
jgi:hypothetical protein